MISTFIASFEDAVCGRSGTVVRRDNDWVFRFGQGAADGCDLVVETMWRVIAGGRIAYGIDDDGQRFGLPAPVDGRATAESLLEGRTALSVAIAPVTGDLAIQFGEGVRLDIVTMSSGYEAWQAYFRHDGDEITLVCGGGGNLSFVRAPVGSNPRAVFGQPLSSW